MSLNKDQKKDLQKLLGKYKDVFSKEGEPISSTPLVEHEIHTRGPPRQATLSPAKSVGQGTGTEPG